MNLRFALLLSCNFICSLSFSQYVKRVKPFAPASFITRNIGIYPSWQVNRIAMLREKAVSIDSVYFYKQKEKNRDSTLELVLYIDSAGNTTERDEYSFNDRELKKITTLTYQEGFLFKKEEISQPMFIIKNSFALQHAITTYEYDSAGNLVTEKLYSGLGDSLKKPSLTVWNREYNNEGHLVKEFETLPGGHSYFHRKYDYDVFGKLSTLEIYDQENNWMYSYQYQYASASKTQKIYMQNPHEQIIESEILYDDQNRPIKIQKYSDGEIFAKHITETFSYGSAGLVETQSYQDQVGDNYYFKHFYSYNQ